MEAFSEQVKTDGFKTFVVKPITLLSPVLKFMGQEDRYPALVQFAEEGCWVKAMIGVSEIFTKLLGVCRSLSTRAADGEVMSRQCWVWSKEKSVSPEPPKLKGDLTMTAGEAVAGKIFTLASWCISMGDTIGMAGRYRPLHKLLGGATPWIYSIAGGYMGAQGAYAEVQFQKRTWHRSLPSEKYLGALNLATSVNYCCLSVSGFLGLYYKDSKPAWLTKWQFGFMVGSTVLPAAQKCAREWLHPSTKKAP
jgi:hypothetical protein